MYIELLDYEHFSLEIVWILPLLALTLSDQGALRWSLPRAWRWPLVAWALVVAVSWPIVFMRETDFSAVGLAARGREHERGHFAMAGAT